MMSIDGSDIVHNLAEHFRLLCDQIRERFPVQLNVCPFQMIHKKAVGKPSLLGGFPNAGNPKLPKIALFVFPSGKCVLTAMQICLFGNPRESAFGHPVTFGGLK